MRKVAINSSYGIFSLSQKARALIAARKTCGGCICVTTTKACVFYPFIKRDDPVLISVIEDLGIDANGPKSRIKIVYIPQQIDFEIMECKGKEWIVEKYHYWH